VVDLDERLRGIEERIARACAAAGRRRDELTLVAVSKQQPDEAIAAFHRLGIRDFGESKVQALAGRVERLTHLDDLRWHAIGPLQTNKAKDIGRLMEASGGRVPALVHTIDRVALVGALEKRLSSEAAIPLACLVQVDIDDEPQKAGVPPSELEALVDAVAASPVLELRGLMAIPRPLDEVGEAALGRSFGAMRRLIDGISDRLTGEAILSLGMSDDFELAIAHGATHVRIGSALFGPRLA
jgi:pyridoxal phosphate enzyme (YggS family)